MLWELSTGGGDLAAPALDTDGNLYVPSPTNNLCAIDREGRQKWVFSTRYGQFESPVIGRNGTIYVPAGDLYALSPSGQEFWRFDLAGSGPVATCPAGTIYLSARGGLRAVGADGLERWSYGPTGLSQCPPVIEADGTVYAVTDIRYPDPDPQIPGPGFLSATLLSGFSPEGKLLWTAPPWDPWTHLDWYVAGTMAVSSDGTILSGGRACRPGAPDLTPFIQDWVMGTNSTGGPPPCPIGGSPPYSTVIGNSGVVYYGECDAYVYNLPIDPSYYSSDPYLHAVNPDGSLKWEVPVDGGLLGAAVDAQENIYFGTGTGKFFALDGEGNTQWQLDLGSAVGIPTLGPDGVIYVGTAAGKVFAIKVAAGPGASPWPQFQRNAQHTGSMESYLTITKPRQLSLAGIPTRTYRIEFSESLVNPQWGTVTNVTLATDAQAFADLLPTNSVGGFYRAVLLP